MSWPESFARRRPDLIRLSILAIVISAIAVLGSQYIAPLRQASRWLDDLRLAYLVPPIAQNPDVVVLAINEETMRQMPYRSPIDRGFIADLVELLCDQYRPRAIGIDTIFDQPTTPLEDARLMEVLRAAKCPIVVATGEPSTGLSSEQLAFQSNFLAGISSGSAMLGVQGGSIRTYYPASPASGAPTFVHAVAIASGIESPTTPVPILFRSRALQHAAPIRVFPAQSLHLLPKEWLERRIVLIGADLTDRDQHRTPLSVLGADNEFMAGVMIHAQTLAQLATGASVPAISATLSIAIVLCSVVLGLMLALLPLTPALRITLALAILATYLYAALSSNVYVFVSLPVIGPLLGFSLSAAVATSLARQQERRQKKFLHSAFNQYVSPQIIDDLLANPQHLELGGEVREMSFMFTDIAGFSSLAERLEPEQLVDLLTDYLDGVVEIALKHRGTIARFVGDGLVIFFGAPVRDADHRQQAVQCALDIDAFCEAYRQRRHSSHELLGETRIGVNSGRAVVGNVGGRRRFEYTAHGDAINTAARLESANRLFGTRVCISSETLGADPGAAFRPIGRVIVKGRTTPVMLYTTWDVMAADAQQAYLDAYDMMRDGSAAAIVAIAALSERFPDDALLRLHLARLRAGETGITFSLAEK
ncbi:MAG TPA: adenylate/guanylate cyclase domain-containing protein [Woeseiaceae bacterium]|nr:adenylate/guanylate cyclase domain-containing protein [Woeseiaceae bacterium]